MVCPQCFTPSLALTEYVCVLGVSAFRFRFRTGRGERLRWLRVRLRVYIMSCTMLRIYLLGERFAGDRARSSLFGVTDYYKLYVCVWKFRYTTTLL